MANSMKFGNGQWATKKDSILAFNDENANFKPLPFTASRASTATRVNKAGLLETVASGIPRVDYLGNTKGAYLLEPQSTNLIAQSEAFGSSYWIKNGASIEGDASTGVEKAVNGDFATDTDWNKNANWTISGGTANASGSSSGDINQGNNTVVGKTYLVSYNIVSISVSSVRLKVGGVLTVAKTTTGTYTETIVPTSTDNLRIQLGGNTICSIDNVSVKEVQGFASPSASSPLGAFKLTEDSNNGNHYIVKQNAFTTNGNNHTWSLYAKRAENRYIALTNRQGAGIDGIVIFDLQDGGFSSTPTTVIDSWFSEELSNGWFKISFVSKTNGSPYDNFVISLSKDGNSDSYQGDGTSGVYIFGAQLEQSSYATSYIPTAGSAITRLADTASQTVPDGIINSSEGVLYFESKGFSDRDNGLITLSDGTNSNRLGINFPSVGIINCFCFTASSFKFNINFGGQVQNSLNKIAFSWGGGNYKVYINGILKSSFMADSPLASVFNKIAFNQGSSTSGKFQGDAKDLRVYNTALTDAELAKLTKI